MARLCEDEGMLNAYRQGKDLYADIASVAFNYPYEECLEYFPKDTPIKCVNGVWKFGSEDDYDKLADGEHDVYVEGKNRRSQAKSILLGKKLPLYRVICIANKVNAYKAVWLF